MDDLTLRAPTGNDLRALSRLHFLAWGHAYTGTYPQWFLDERDEHYFLGLWQTFLEDDQRPVIAAEMDGRFCGFVRYGRPAGGPASDSDSTGELLTMYVAPNRRGRGIGTQMMSSAETEMRRLGYERGELTAVCALDKTIEFYSRHGWSVSIQKHQVDFGGFSPEVVRMTKDLKATNL